MLYSVPGHSRFQHGNDVTFLIFFYLFIIIMCDEEEEEEGKEIKKIKTSISTTKNHFNLPIIILIILLIYFHMYQVQ